MVHQTASSRRGMVVSNRTVCKDLWDDLQLGYSVRIGSSNILWDNGGAASPANQPKQSQDGIVSHVLVRVKGEERRENLSS